MTREWKTWAERSSCVCLQLPSERDARGASDTVIVRGLDPVQRRALQRPAHGARGAGSGGDGASEMPDEWGVMGKG